MTFLDWFDVCVSGFGYGLGAWFLYLGIKDTVRLLRHEPEEGEPYRAPEPMAIGTVTWTGQSRLPAQKIGPRADPSHRTH